MNVVIVNAYNRHNAGDAALLSSTIAQVHEAFADANILFAGLENPVDYSDFEGSRNVGSIRRWVGDESSGRYHRIWRKILALSLCGMPPSSLRWLSRQRAVGDLSEPIGEIRAIVNADLVIGLGGGYLNGTPSLAGTMNVFFLLLPIWLASRLRRPVVLAPQSYGPFGLPVQKYLVRLCLNRVGRVLVREDVSLDQLRAIGVVDSLLERGVDSAFALGLVQKAPAEANRDSGFPRVGITARAWLSKPEQDSYERSLAAFIDWLVESRGASVTMIPQVTSDYRDDDDRSVARRVAAHCSSPPHVIDLQLDHGVLRSLYGSLDYLVGTRFHSVIFSLTTGTPALAIEYEHKASGIMRDLGLEDWVIPIQEVTAQRLCDEFSALETAHAEYMRLLHERLPAYVERAHGFTGVLRQSVS